MEGDVMPRSGVWMSRLWVWEFGSFCLDGMVDGIGRVSRGNVGVGLVDGRCGF